MNYRVLGKSGIRVSEVGVGGHQNKVPRSGLSDEQASTWRTDFLGDVPAVSHVERAQVIGRALDLGVNYFDTSLDIETESLGRSLKILGRRGECVATLVAGVLQYLMPDTNSYWAKKAVAQDIDRGLELFGYDHFDVCIVCMCNAWYGPGIIEGALDATDDARTAGKIRAVGISDHQDGEFSAHVIERYGDRLDMVMYPLNYLRSDAATRLLPLVKEQNLGFVAMKALARGEVLTDPDFRAYADSVSLTPAAASFHWTLQHSEVSVALGAVNAVAEIEENVRGSV